MITLYGAMASRAHRCVWMLRECGLAFEHVPTGFQDGGTRTPAFLAINPNGRVPVLVDDGFVLFESLAINAYLAAEYGGALGPADGQEQARVAQWSLWVANEIEGPLLFTAANTRLFADDSRDAEQARLGLAKLDRPLKVLDAHLAGRPHVLGDRFTVADLNIATVMDLAPQCDIALDAWPHVRDWHRRCLARPAASDWRDVRFTIPRPPTTLGLLRMFV